MTVPRFVQSILIAATLSVAAVPAVSAQTAADLFDGQTLQELRIVMNARDLQELREHFGEDTYYPADLIWRDQHVRNVAVRSRGLGSRSPIKPGLKVDFNRYTDGQKFLGLESLVLDNLLQDPAMVRERVAMAFYARLGQPASRESFCRLYLNDQYQGLYAIVESVDADFVSRTLGHKGGYLFEYKWHGPYYGSDLGDESAYKPLFEPRTHKSDADAMLYPPIRDLFHEASQPVDTVWRDRVSRYLDLQQFVTHVAVEMFLSEPDGVLGRDGMANFYLYRDDNESPHRFIVWDKDRTFAQIDSPILLRAEENVLFRGAFAFADLRALFLSVMEQCVRSATEDNWLELEIGRAAALIDAAAHEDVSKPYANSAYEAAVDDLKKFARERPTFVLEDMARTRGNYPDTPSR